MMDWVPLNLSETREALQRFPTMEERGLWICGYHMGATGSILMGGETEAFIAGYQCGAKAHADSSEHREKVSAARREAASKRWAKRAEEPLVPPSDAGAPCKPDAIASANEGANADATADATAPANEMQTGCTRQDKTGQDNTPPNPPGGDGEEVELGETEKRVASAWDSIAVPAGFAPAGAWSKRRRRALRTLIAELGATPDQFVQSWARAVKSMSRDAWSRDQGVNIDGLLAPALFRRRLDAWRPSREESRTPPPRYPSVPAETTRANHAALMNGLFPPRRTDAAIEADSALSAA